MIRRSGKFEPFTYLDQGLLKAVHSSDMRRALIRVGTISQAHVVQIIADNTLKQSHCLVQFPS